MSTNSYLTQKKYVFISLFIGIIALGVSVLKVRDIVVDRISIIENGAFQNAAFLLKEKVNSYIHGLHGMGGIYFVTDFKIKPSGSLG